MKKINIVKKNLEFNNIIEKGKKYQNETFYMYIMNNELGINRYGIAISKKIGNAVIRNRYKRQIKDIIDDLSIRNINKDIIIIAKSNIKVCDYILIKNSLSKLFDIIGEKYEK